MQGTSKYGELGHGDTVAHETPRLVKRLKGKEIAKIFAGTYRSFAIDSRGLLYWWGWGAEKLPEPHPYFVKVRVFVFDKMTNLHVNLIMHFCRWKFRLFNISVASSIIYKFCKLK